MLKLVTGLLMTGERKPVLKNDKPKMGNILTNAKQIDPKSDPSVKTKKVYIK